LSGSRTVSHDVVIIGGGPVGSEAACRLSRSGRRVIVLEKKAHLEGPVCCTGIVSRECGETFTFGSDVILRKVNSARVFSPSGRTIGLRREETQAYVLDRAALNREMACRARESGAEYISNCEVIKIDPGIEHVTVTASSGSGSADYFARSALVAGGFNPKSGEWPLSSGKCDFAAGAQAEVDIADCEEVEVYFGKKFAPGFFAWLVPASEGKALAGLVAYRQAGIHLRDFLLHLYSIGKIRTADVRILTRPLPFDHISKTYGRRTLVAGAAAGQVKPLTGGGIYYGMLCADIAASTLDEALDEDDLSAKRLSVYESSWKELLGREMRSSYRGHRLLRYLSDAGTDRIFEIAQSRGIFDSLLEMKDVTFDWHSNALKRLVKQKLFSLQ
jgi:digeranylgeranylglycerophospholipid reductase